MKRLLSVLISASIISSMAVTPVFAEDGAAEEYNKPLTGYSQSKFGPHSANEQKTHAYEPFKELEKKEARFEQPYAQNTVVFKRSEGKIGLFGENDTDRLLDELGAVTEVISESKNGIGLFSADKEVTYKAEISSETPVKDAVEQLSAMEDIIYAEPDYLFYSSAEGTPDGSLDEGYAKEWFIPSTDPAVEASWEYLLNEGFPYGGSSDTVVAVIDTGVDYTHEDLSNSMWVNLAELNGTPGVDDDGNGYVDDIHGISTVGNSYSHSGNPMDDHGHGTHVAGIIGMTANNGKGGIGIAPGAKIMAIKAGQASGVFSSTDIAEAINYAAAMGADVINMSFGSKAASSVVEDALINAFGSSVLVAAAGNDGANVSSAAMYPAAYTYVLGVMAHDQNGSLASFSNYDSTPNDNTEYEIIAPGVEIFSTLPGNRYASWSGTSMAAPMVAGAAALLRSKFRNKSVYSSRFIMGQLASATTRTAAGYKRLNIYDSLTNLPKPNLTYAGHYIFDTKDIDEVNDSDGIIDAGEVIDLAVILRNQWGKADNVTLTVDTKNNAGAANPYVMLLTDSVDYGAIGTFNEDDNGLIRNDEGKITGVEHPIRFWVSDDAPNDTVINLNLRVTAKNGFDENDTEVYTAKQTISFLVQKGKAIKGVISEDMTLTKDNYWIIENATLIPEGVTVNVEPGTQIQFWSSEPEGPYDEKAMANLQVEGQLNVTGTEEEPVEIFPSEGFVYAGNKFGCEISGNDNSVTNMEYVNIINPRFNGITKGSHLKAVQDSYYICRRYLNSGSVITEIWGYSRLYGNSINDSKISLGGCYYGYIIGNYTNVLFDNCYNYYYFSNYTDMNGYTSYQYKNSVFLENNKSTDQVSVTSLSYVHNGLDTSFITFSDIAEYNGKKYMGISIPSNAISDYENRWQLAQNLAKKYFGYIASINSSEEHQFLYNIFGYGSYIGLYKDGEGNLSWDSGEPIDYLPQMHNDWYKHYIYAFINFYNIEWGPDINNNYIILEFPDTVSDEAIASKEALWEYIGGMTNSATLNRTIISDSSTWMRPTAPNGNTYAYNFTNNYWGTTDNDLIQAQIVDFDDYMTLGDIKHEPYLTEPPEDCYPFVTNVEVFDDSGQKITQAGAQNITVKVSFNRDMAPDVDPTVSFAAAEPWTDYIVKGEWTDARTWTGEYKINPMTGDGTMYFRVIGAAAADDKWLVTGDDWGRFAFEIVTSGAEALTLQAAGGENRVDLTWTQDDYDVLAGYNLYRSTSQDGRYTKINTTLIPAETKEYTDTDVLPGVRYYYKFTVIDTAMNESDYSNTAQAAPIDNIKPAIAHTPVSSAPLSTDIQISADITDNIGVNLASLRYRAAGGEWKEAEMKIISGNRYIAKIPAGEVSGDMEYYIMATDGTSMAYEGSEAVPYIISVNNAPVIYSISPVNTSMTSGTRIYITGANFKEGIKVYVGDGEATNLEFTDSEHVSAIMPENPVGVYDVKVISGDGQTAVLPRAFSYLQGGLTVQIQTGRGIAGQTVSVPVSVTDAGSVRSASFSFTYDTSILTLNSIEKTISASGFSLEQSETTGTVKVSMAAAEEAKGNIPLVYLNFKINDGAEFEQTPITLTEAKVNGIAAEHLVNGSVTAVENHSVSGYVNYYNTGSRISGVTVSATAQKNAATDNNGYYTISGLIPDSYTIVPSKSDEQTEISAYDASLVLKYSVGKTNLSSYQLLAADVDGSGVVDEEDASEILKAAVGKITGAFPGSNKVWTFSPSSTDVTVSDYDINYQGFTGILMGDVSGNWGGGYDPELFGAREQKTVSVPSGSSEFEAPLYISGDDSGSAADIKVSVSDNVSGAYAVLSDKAADFAIDQSFDGKNLTVAAAGSRDISFDGAVIVKIKTDEPVTSENPVNIDISSVKINEESVSGAESIIFTADDGEAREIPAINDYENKLYLEFKNNSLIITPKNSEIDLTDFKLYLAEYDENDSIISIKTGKVYKADGAASIVCDAPESGNYRYFLWNSEQSPVTLPIEG